MHNTKIEGLIIREEISGESSKKLTFIAKDIGKMYIFAKGARRPKSNLFASTNIYTYAELIVCQKNNFYMVNQADTIRSFYNISKDIFKLSESVYITELVDRTLLVGEENNDIIRLIYTTLNKLEKSNMQPSLISRIFEIKYLQMSGFLASVECIDCGRTDKLYFHKTNGEFFCDAHMPLMQWKLIKPSVIDALNFVMENDLKHMFNFNINNETLKQLDWLMEIYIKIHLNVSLRSRNFTKTLNMDTN